MPKNILIPSDPLTETEDLRHALDEVSRLVASSPGAEEVVLYAPMRDIHSTTLAPALGEEVARELSKKGRSQWSGIPLTLVTQRTIGRPMRRSILLAVYTDDRMMEKVDTTTSLIEAVIAHPHAKGALDQWILAWSPQMLGEPLPTAPSSQISDPVVQKAMKELTRDINLPSGVLGVRDEMAMKEVINALRILGHHREPAENLRAWATSHGWPIGPAKQLGAYAGKMFSRATPPRKPDAETLNRYKSRWM